MLVLPVSRSVWPDLLLGAVADADRDLVVTAEQHDVEATGILQRHGFRPSRTEVTYRASIGSLPARLCAPVRAAGVQLISAADADLDRLRLLDDLVRQDIPGSRGWRWAAADFQDETFGPGFDPQTYLVAVERRSGDYVGLVRVWMRPAGSRLGCIGVVHGHRGTRVTAALLTTVFGELRDRGVETLTFEISQDNRASMAMLRHVKAIPTAHHVEFVHPR